MKPTPTPPLMHRRRWLGAGLGLGAATAAAGATGLLAGVQALGTVGGGPAPAPDLQWQTRLLLGLGTQLRLQAGHADEATLGRALDAAVQRLRDIEAQLSLFRPDSALSRLNRDGELAAPPADLVQVLQIAQAVSEASEGAFDVTVQPLWALFRQAQGQGRLPRPDEVARARARVGWRALVLTPGRVRFTRAGMGVTLNGIAQGYAADQVRATLAAHGVRHALVDAGEFAPGGHNPQGEPWVLGLAAPHAGGVLPLESAGPGAANTTDAAADRHASAPAPEALIARLVTDGRCVASSADDACAFSPDHRHHHIVDPATGWSPTGLSAVTVAAPSGALADALTKVFFMAGPARADALARQWGVDALWMDKAGRWQATPGLQLREAARA